MISPFSLSLWNIFLRVRHLHSAISMGVSGVVSVEEVFLGNGTRVLRFWRKLYLVRVAVLMTLTQWPQLLAQVVLVSHWWTLSPSTMVSSIANLVFFSCSIVLCFARIDSVSRTDYLTIAVDCRDARIKVRLFSFGRLVSRSRNSWLINSFTNSLIHWFIQKIGVNLKAFLERAHTTFLTT